jgi:hypothetical protein
MERRCLFSKLRQTDCIGQAALSCSRGGRESLRSTFYIIAVRPLWPLESGT